MSSTFVGTRRLTISRRHRFVVFIVAAHARIVPRGSGDVYPRSNSLTADNSTCAVQPGASE
jgi:hypothetical protein